MQGGPTAFSELIEGAARKRGNDQPHTGRKHRWQPDEVGGVIAVFQLIQPVQNENHTAFGGGLAKRTGKGRSQLLGFIRDFDLELEPTVEFAQEAPQHGRPIGAGRRGANKVHEHKLTRVSLPVACGPVREHRRFARA